jgi:RNA polymerase sigma-70 factor (ECF subfamily)
MPERAAQAKADLDLMQRVAASEEKAVGELYDRFGSLVFKMAFQAMPTRAEADDAVQEIFIRLWKTSARYDPERAALVTWVMLISRRQLVDRMRRTRARVRTSSLDEGLSMPASGWGSGWGAGSGRGSASGAYEPSNASADSPSLEREERLEALMKRIDALPELQKTVVKRAYLGGQTLRQIGEELDTPLGTVKSALSRALTRLRERGGEELAL